MKSKPPATYWAIVGAIEAGMSYECAVSQSVSALGSAYFSVTVS